MKNNKKIIWLLTGMLLIVWGAIGFQIISALFQGDENDLAAVVTNDFGKNRKLDSYHYTDDTRDPFRFFIQIKKDSAKHVFTKQLSPVWSPPPFRLTGILINEKKRTAVLEGNDGSVSFLHEKDSIVDVQIIKITQTVVIYKYQKKNAEWRIQ